MLFLRFPSNESPEKGFVLLTMGSILMSNLEYQQRGFAELGVLPNLQEAAEPTRNTASSVILADLHFHHMDN